MSPTFRLCALMFFIAVTGSAQYVLPIQIKCSTIKSILSELPLQFHYRYNLQQQENISIVSFDGGTGSSAAPIYFSDSIPQTILWKPFNPSTIGIQLLTGTCAVGLTAALFIPAAGIVGKNSSGEGSIGAVVGVLIIGGFVASNALPAGIYLGGNWSGGNGSYWWTFFGCLSAGGIALLPNIMEGTDRNGAAIIRVPIAVFAGSILGYHLSSSRVYTTEKESGIRIQKDDELSQQTWHRMLPQNDVTVTLISFSF